MLVLTGNTTDAQIMALPAGTDTDSLVTEMRETIAGRPLDADDGTRPTTDTAHAISLLHECRRLTGVAAWWSEDGDGDELHWWVKVGEHQAHGPLALTTARLYLMAVRDELNHRSMQ